MGEAGAQNHSIQGYFELIYHGQHRDSEPSHRRKPEHVGGDLRTEFVYLYKQEIVGWNHKLKTIYLSNEIYQSHKFYQTN